MPPKSQPNGKAPSSKPTAAAFKRSRLAANARSASQGPSAGQTTRDSPTLDWIDYQTIITYISKPAIRNALFGGGSHTRISGMPMGPKAVLTPLAMELNNDYNLCHNTTKMRLNGQILHLRVKRYLAKYKAAQAFSLKTGSGLLAKNCADGISTMDNLLDSMCCCYKEMDAIFRDRGNITLFGILDTGADPSNDSKNEGKETLDITQDDSDGNITEGHHHRTQPPMEIDLCTLPQLALPGSNSVTNPLNNHDLDSQSKNKSTQKQVIKKEKVTSGPTAKARALDDTTSDKEDLTQATTSATDWKRLAPRSTLLRRGLEELPLIDPSHGHSKDHKNALASAIQQGNEARFEMINKANALESGQIQAEQDARASDLSWAKERYFLDRQEQREAKARRLSQESQKERKAFCKRLVMEGKTPQELEAYLALVYPAQKSV
ncbi:hypothetical protein DFH28DRAFT_1119019 [Melampsora americana]|nr:hypothetical protein DFH28DRAFT_1119019 [Melampsora americana]